MKKCKHPGCDRKHLAKGYCILHYYRMRRGCGMNGTTKNIDKKCEHHNCERPVLAKGYCGMHYQRMINGGDMDVPKTTNQSQSPEQIYERFMSGEKVGHINLGGYMRVKCSGKERALSHIVYEVHNNYKLKKGETVHHKNGIRTDNHPDNLELWTGNHGRGVRKEDLDEWCLAHLHHDKAMQSMGWV